MRLTDYVLCSQSFQALFNTLVAIEYDILLYFFLTIT